MREVTKEQFADSALWKVFEIMIRKGIALIISTLIARLVAPEAYGVVALTTVFITFSDIFILNGFNVALIRKENVDEQDYSTVMILSIAFSTIVYIILYLSAPLLSTFYKSPELKNVLRVISILIFFQSVSTVIRAKATRELQIKKLSFVSIVGNLASSIIALILAYVGYGVWALVVQQLLSNVFDAILLIFAFKWRFLFSFSKIKAKEMMSFSLGVLGASFLDFVGNNVSSLVVGKVYTTTDLAYINRGTMYPETISLNTYNAINSVLLPTLASRQDDREKLKGVVRRVISVTEYILVPMMLGLAAISDKFVLVLLTEKWIKSVPILVFVSINSCANPIRSIGYQVFYAIGESKRSFHIEIVRSVVMILSLIVTVVILRKSIYVLVAMNMLISFFVAFVTQLQVSRCINYKMKELLSDIIPSIAMSLIMVFVVRLLTLLPFSDELILVTQVITGSVLYISMSFMTKNNNFKFLKSYVIKKTRSYNVLK